MFPQEQSNKLQNPAEIIAKPKMPIAIRIKNPTISI